MPLGRSRQVVQALRSLCLFVSHFLARKHDPEPRMVNDLPPRTAFAQTKGVLSQLPVPGEVLAEFTSRGNEGRMARGHSTQSVPQRARSVAYCGRGASHQHRFHQSSFLSPGRFPCITHATGDRFGVPLDDRWFPHRNQNLLLDE